MSKIMKLHYSPYLRAWHPALLATTHTVIFHRTDEYFENGILKNVSTLVLSLLKQYNLSVRQKLPSERFFLIQVTSLPWRVVSTYSGWEVEGMTYAPWEWQLAASWLQVIVEERKHIWLYWKACDICKRVILLIYFHVFIKVCINKYISCIY